MKEFKKENIGNFTKIISSSHINFLFGAGVNGGSIPQMIGFREPLNMLESELNRKVVNFENDLNELDVEKRKVILAKFIEELKTADTNVDLKHQDLKDFEDLFSAINRLVIETENRKITMKQVNIYTTNYDSVQEKIISNLGVLFNVISSSKNDTTNDKFFEMVGYDYGKGRYVPTFLISKIHGDLDDPILPNINKYDDTLQAKRFEILFNMKSQLSRSNSVLFIIGYSGNDKHINGILKDCLSSGLSIYWFQYDNDSSLPEEFGSRVTIIKQEDNESKVNSTKMCKEIIEGSWANQSEE